jgi:hypothetical protein
MRVAIVGMALALASASPALTGGKAAAHHTQICR